MNKIIVSAVFWCLLLVLPISVAAQTLTSFGFDSFTAGGAKRAGVPFQIQITAKDEFDTTLTTFTNSVNLSDYTSTIYPIQSSSFTDGVWTGNVYITQETTNTAITAQYSTVQDTSTAFAVVPDDRIKLLTIVSGNNQTGIVNSVLPTALVVKVVDPYNNAISAAGINFAVSSYPPDATGQTLSNSSTTTDSDGEATTTLTLGRKKGNYTVTGTLTGGPIKSVTFFQNAAADVLNYLVIDPPLAVIPAGAQMPFTIKGYDVYQNERTLSSVTWNVRNGGGTIDATGLFTSGSTLGTFLNTIEASSSTKGTTATVSLVEGSDGEVTQGSGSGTGSGEQGDPTPTPSPTPPGDGSDSGVDGVGILSEIVIDPAVITALQNAQIPIVAEAFDSAGNAVANVNFTFEVTGSLGTLTQTSTNTVLLTASESGIGTVTITAQQGDVVKVAKIVGSVGTGLNRRLVIEDIESPQFVGEPFTISIAAKDTLNNFITDYTGPIVLTDTTGTIDPAVVESNEDGVWFVQAILSLSAPEISITVAGDGMVGVSNIFEVLGEPKLSDVAPGGAGNQTGEGGLGEGLGDALSGILGASVSAKLNELLKIKDLNKFTVARYIGAGLAAGIGILGASIGGGIMAGRGLEAMGRNPFAKNRLKFNLYLSVLAFVVASGLAAFAAYIIVR